MSALPGSPQAPIAAAPPTIADIIGSPPPQISVPGLSPQTGATAPPVVDATPNPITDLGSVFGVTGADPAATAAALRPVLEMMAKGGQQQQQFHPQQQQQQFHPQQPPQNSQGFQPQSPQQPEPNALDFSDIDLGDMSPEVAKAFKQLSERSQTAIAAATSKANEVQQALYTQQQEYNAQQEQVSLGQQAEVANRAVRYLDSLASPKYGVGKNRTMVQTIAAEQVMAAAGRLISGSDAYGQQLTIEQIMQGAVLMIDGAVPAPAAPQAAPPIVPLGQFQAPGSAPAVRRQVGSSGGGQILMGDAEFLDGARAILAR